MNAPVNGIRINYETSGQTGPTLVLVHGLGGNLRQWDAQRTALAPSCRVVVPDLRGHGGSDKPPGPYSVKLWADDLAALCRDLKIERCVAVGASIGAAVVFQLAADQPRLVQGVVSVGGFPSLPPAGKDRMTQRVAAVEQGGMAAVVEAILSAALGPSTHAHQPSLVGLSRATLLDNDPAAYAASTRAVIGADVGPLLPAVRCPTMLVFGAEEMVAPLPAQTALKRALPHAALAAIPNAGHLPFLEQPAAFNAALMQFLASLP
jgi:3-oxoadipate enol-lactonase